MLPTLPSVGISSKENLKKSFTQHIATSLIVKCDVDGGEGINKSPIYFSFDLDKFLLQAGCGSPPKLVAIASPLPREFPVFHLNRAYF